MIDLIKVIILGIVEGVTEFLPVSSTGHLIVATALLQFGQLPDGTPNKVFRDLFDIFIQLGAVIAVIVYYRIALLHQVQSVRTDKGVQGLWLGIIVAFIPAGIVGFFLRHWITDHLFSPAVVAASLIVGGIVFIVVERRPITPTKTNQLTSVTLPQALLVGVAQIVALIPGVSRSGASIIGGMLGGLSREVATEFSFYLAIPTLGIATLYSLVTSLSDLSSSDLIFLLVGMIVSGIVAWFAIGWLLRYVSRNNFVNFGYYRILAGIVILVLIAVHFV